MTKDTLVVGADLTGGLAGAAYVYVEGPSTWPTEPTATLHDPMATSGDNFGDDVAISSTSVVIGAEDTSNETGAAYIYSESSGVWPSTPTATLDAPSGSTQFGNSVATSGDETLVTGSSQAGAGYVYTERLERLAGDSDRDPFGQRERARLRCRAGIDPGGGCLRREG